jgi:2'-5' RNA ligase
MYFIAVVAPKEINEALLTWKKLMKDRFDCSVGLRSPAHVTLIPPFWMDDVLESKLEDVINDFSQQQKPLEIRLKNFGFFKPKVIYVDVLRSHPLKELQARLQQHLINRNLFFIKEEDRPFHPHVTIATRDLYKQAFKEAWEIFKEKKFEAVWSATGVSLLRHNQKNWDVIFTSQFK